MDSTSTFLARLIGPLLLVIGAALLFDQEGMRQMATDFLANRALIFLSGFLTLLAGLAIVNTHNVWEARWPVIITILGWLSVIGGAVRILFPGATQSMGETMLQNTGLMTGAGVVELFLGAWLAYVGYKR